MSELISHVECCDCMEFMARYPDKHFELAIVDPPYEIKRDQGFDGFGGFGKPIARKKYNGKWDDKAPEKIYFNELLRISKNCIIFGGNFFTDKLPVMNHWIFWDKLNTMPTFGDGELIYTTFDRNSVKKVTIEYNGLIGKEQNRIHATQKPVKLYKWLLKNYAKPGDKILDTHMGSQSSRIAAYDMGFSFFGTEMDREYFDAGCQRFDRFKAQLKLDL
jgi:site-specific DNA-methyltransferase (adenine-specific)